MGKSSTGLFAARKLAKRRSVFRWSYPPYKRRMLALAGEAYGDLQRATFIVRKLNGFSLDMMITRSKEQPRTLGTNVTVKLVYNKPFFTVSSISQGML